MSVKHCYHCGLDVGPAPMWASIQGQQQVFCCIGCQAVAEMIEQQGLADFYQFRDGASAKPDSNELDFSAYDLPEVQQDFVIEVAPERLRAHLYIPEIRCAACVWLIEHRLEQIPGIVELKVNAASQAASISFNPSQINLSQIFSRLATVGYKPQPMLAETQQQQWRTQQKDELLRLGVAGIGMMQAGMVSVALHAGEIQGIEHQWQQLLRLVSLVLTIPIIAYSAKPFFINALRAVQVRSLNMDVPVALALLLAFIASAYATLRGVGEVYFDSVAMFTFFLLLGRFLEKKARFHNARAKFKRLQLLPLTVEVLEGGIRKTRALKQVRVGERVWVGPGAVVPCDGEVKDGSSEVDEAVLTGEARLVPKTPGDQVIAGSTNGSTGLEVSVSAVGHATQLAAIERLVNEAQMQRPRKVSLADAIAARFVLSVLVTSLVVGAFWLWWDSSKALWVVLSVLVVTCPCALSLATPAVLTAAINRLREHGVLVTGADTLEALPQVSQVVFDKTGTLTSGELSVQEVICLANKTETQVMDLAAALEQGSSHPIARAFSATSSLAISKRETQLGLGVSAQVAGVRYRLGKPEYAFTAQALSYPGEGLWLLLASEHEPIAWLKLQDQVRTSAAPAVAGLTQQGLHTYIMSGDRLENVASVAHTVGVQDWAGELLPAQKLARLQALQERGQSVMMVGDGINDVPVLARANVSVAMGSATEFAQNQADCVLLGDDLAGLARLMRTSVQVQQIIKQNFAWAFFYNIFALPLAASGLVPPWAAALGMSASSLVVVLNALRVGR